jgi:hypothetical protein
MTATNVGKSNTINTTDVELQRESSGNVCRLRTPPLRCYRGLKLPLVFEPNTLRKEGGRPKPPFPIIGDWLALAIFTEAFSG